MFISSSIWQGIKEPFFALQSESRWLVGESSSVYFWLDDWVAIADRLGIPTHLRKRTENFRLLFRRNLHI